MDIKLKRDKKGFIIRGVTFLLCVVLFLCSLVGYTWIYSKSGSANDGNGVDDLLLYDSYKNSAAFQREFGEKLSRIQNLLATYKGESYILQGRSVTDERLLEAARQLFYQEEYSYESYPDGTLGKGVFVTIREPGLSQRYGGDFDNPTVREPFLNDYAEDLKQIKESIIMEDLRRWKSELRSLDEEGFQYYATDGTYFVTNMSKAQSGNTEQIEKAIGSIKDKPAYLVYQNETMAKVPQSSRGIESFTSGFDRDLEEQLDQEYNSNYVLGFGYEQSFLEEKQAEFQMKKEEVEEVIPLIIATTLLSLVLFVYLIVVTGRIKESSEIRIYRIDRIYTEIQVSIITALFFGGGAIFFQLLLNAMNYSADYDARGYHFGSPFYLSVALAAVIGMGAAGLGLFFILSVIRNIKGERFWKNTFLGALLLPIWRGLKSTYRSSSAMKKMVMICLVLCVMSATVILAPVAVALVLVFAPKWIHKYEEIKEGVEQVRTGHLEYRIPVEGKGELEQLARGINEISKASSIAVQNELKNQRMKTELISNVSHDLKTPLTSILTYVDLLKREGLTSQNAEKYLEVIDQKSKRLQKLTEDLFDAAKASSGAMPVQMERVDMMFLVKQALGEMNDRIETSGLEFRIKGQNDRYCVWADGQLLWRVMENLLGNVLKYALEGSRVYIDLHEIENQYGESKVVLEVKNISKQELNVDADELMERFKRGDLARTTEGSGLGLAITRDLVRIQKGQFEIKIDGDLFKAVVVLDGCVEDSNSIKETEQNMI